MPKKRAIFKYVCLFQALAVLIAFPVHAEILFDGEWDDFGSHFQRKGHEMQWLADNRPNHWHTIQEKQLGRVSVVVDPGSPKHGAVARFEVGPGDNVGWTGERVEVSDMLHTDPVTKQTASFPVLESDGREFYGIAVKLAPDWQSPQKDHGNGATWGVFLQLHSPDNFEGTPPFAMAVTDAFHVDYCGGDLVEGGTRKNHRDSTKMSLTDGSLNAGHWVEFMIDAKWSYAADGHLVIYRRDEGQSRFKKVLDMENVPTLQTEYGTPEGAHHHYWKTGFYRSTTAGMTNTLWLGPLVRGTSFDEVAEAAFGKSGPR